MEKIELNKTVSLNYTLNYIPLFKDLDFLEKRLLFLSSEKEEVSLSYSVEDERFPVNEKFVRGETIIGGLFVKFKEQEKIIEICSMNQVDSKIKLKNTLMMKNMIITQIKNWLKKFIAAYNEKKCKDSKK